MNFAKNGILLEMQAWQLGRALLAYWDTVEQVEIKTQQEISFDKKEAGYFAIFDRFSARKHVTGDGEYYVLPDGSVYDEEFGGAYSSLAAFEKGRAKSVAQLNGSNQITR